MLAVIVDAARVIDVAFAELHLAQQLAGAVELEQVSGPLAGRPVEPVARCGKALRRLEDLDRGHVEALADLQHALRMVGRERDRNGRDRLPGAALGHAQELVGDGVVGVRGADRKECGKAGDNGDGFHGVPPMFFSRPPETANESPVTGS